jgi:acetyl-CoA carboxylase biotin carboxyl carrier protein
MQRHGLEEFDYERDGLRIRLKKPSAQVPMMFQAPTVSPALLPPSGGPAGAVRVPAGAAAPPAAAAPAESADLHIVKSPIVGTYYASPSPEAAPFVTVGGRIEKGQPLCIIEAMKLMNEIEADVGGEVAKIFVENGQPVEYGEPLFGIQPDRKK